MENNGGDVMITNMINRITKTQEKVEFSGAFLLRKIMIIQ